MTHAQLYRQRPVLPRGTDMIRPGAQQESVADTTSVRAPEPDTARHNQTVCRILRNVGYPVPADFGREPRRD